MRSDWRPIPAGVWPEGLILYDGVCVLCSRWVRKVIARDPARRFRFVSVQSPYGRAMARSLGIDPEAPETNAVVSGGLAHFKSDAVLAVLSGLEGVSAAKAFAVLPKPLRDRLYDRLASNRYRLFGQSDVCIPPPPAERGRFLDDAAPPAEAG